MLDMRAVGSLCGAADPRPEGLRESAGRKVPFSQDKILLRAAASAIERLYTDVRNRAADVGRLTAELKVLRGVPGSS